MSYALEIETRRSWLFVLVLGAAAATRLHALDRFSYWFDEILQCNYIHADSEFLWRAIRFEAVHPPLDYLADHALENLHPADWTRKLLPAAWGIVAVATFGRLLIRRIGARAGIIAAALLAFAPFHVRYSQELRPYSLGVALLTASLLALDRFLERPDRWRLLFLYLGCLGTLYTLYLAAWVLFVAAAGMIADDAFSQNPERRRSARRFLLATPVFCIALLAAYSPWLPVVLRAARRPPPVPAAPLTPERAGRILGFFAFESSEGVQPERADLAFLALAAAGTVMAIRRPGSRFLVAWGIGGLAAVEGLYRLHPDWDAARRYLPAAIALVGLAALPVSGLMSTKTGKILAVALLAGVLLLQTAALRTYFRTGRQDWRPLGAFLKARPAEEQIFAENQWSQICTAFYVIGPEWLADGGRHGRPVSNLDGEIVRLTYSWPAGKTAWLVVEGNPQRQELRAWARQFEEIPFPTADGARVYRLDPSRRDTALAGR